METSLHQQLKRLYACDNDQVEVKVDGYRIDAINSDGELVEIQQASLGQLRDKTRQLLPPRGKRRLRIIKPLITRKKITTLDHSQQQVLRSRMSPKRNDWLDIFMDLVHFATVFPRKRLTLEILLIEAEELRVDRVPKRKRSKPYQTVDIRLIDVGPSIHLQTTNDLLSRLPLDQLPSPFDTQQLAEALNRPRWFAQKVAYCLRTMGCLKSLERRKSGHHYQLSTKRLKKIA